jgi:hypothetical protein
MLILCVPPAISTVPYMSGTGTLIVAGLQSFLTNSYCEFIFISGSGSLFTGCENKKFIEKFNFFLLTKFSFCLYHDVPYGNF